MNEINPIYKSIARGTAWSMAMRWMVRAIGLINVVIIARILTPEDFGLVAMASVVLGLTGVFLEFGVEIQVIRSDRTDAAFLNTAWTVKVLRGIFIGVCLVAVSPLAASYFGRAELSGLMMVLALASVLNGFSNIGIVLFRKELNFAADLRYEVLSKIVTVAATIALAAWLRNYWALVLGHLVGAVGHVVLSYLMHRYRPRFSLRDGREFLNFTVFSTGIAVGTFLNRRLDIFVVGKIAPTTAVGVYNMAIELSSMFIGEIVKPIGRSLFPNYARVKQDMVQTRSVFLNMLSLVTIIVMPMGFGLSAVGEEAVIVLLGHQWTAVPPLLAWLAIGESLRAILHHMKGNLLMVLKKEHISLLCVWIQLLVLAPFVVVGGIVWGQLGIVCGIVIASVLTLPIFTLIVGRQLDLAAVTILERLWRPTAAVAVMYAVLMMIPAHPEAPFLWLPVKVSVGAVIYTIVLTALIYISAGPDDFERKLVRRVFAMIGSRIPGPAS